MQNKTKMVLAAGAAALLAMGGAAGMASADGGWGKGHAMGHGRGMMHMQMMERYDTDKDGKITQAEIDANRTQWHGEFDGDKSNALSLDEFQNLWLKARREQMVREFQRFDRDGDGLVTVAEYFQPMASMVADHDRNGDGALSRDDRRERHGKRGDRMRGMGQGMGMGMGNPPAEAPAEEDQQ